MDFTEHYSCHKAEYVKSAYWNLKMILLRPVAAYFKTNKLCYPYGRWIATSCLSKAILFIRLIMNFQNLLYRMVFTRAQLDTLFELIELV